MLKKKILEEDFARYLDPVCTVDVYIVSFVLSVVLE